MSVDNASLNGDAKDVTHALGVAFPVLGSSNRSEGWVVALPGRNGDPGLVGPARQGIDLGSVRDSTLGHGPVLNTETESARALSWWVAPSLRFRNRFRDMEDIRTAWGAVVVGARGRAKRGSLVIILLSSFVVDWSAAPMTTAPLRADFLAVGRETGHDMRRRHAAPPLELP